MEVITITDGSHGTDDGWSWPHGWNEIELEVRQFCISTERKNLCNAYLRTEWKQCTSEDVYWVETCGGSVFIRQKKYFM